MTFNLTSPAFKEGDTIPKEYTCEGQNHSPELHWSEVPANTQGYALIVDDPDAPVGTFTHWVLFNIPGNASALAQGATSGVAGRNDFGRSGYGGTCPPRGDGPERYFFKRGAVDGDSLNFNPGGSARSVGDALPRPLMGGDAL